MKHGFYLVALLSSAAVAQPVHQNPGLPTAACNVQYPNWDNCVGTWRYPNGNVYHGEFHHGKRDGFGVIVIYAKGISDHNNILSNEVSVYVGTFRNDKLNGHGVWTTMSGMSYAGTFVDNVPQADVAPLPTVAP